MSGIVFFSVFFFCDHTKRESSTSRRKACKWLMCAVYIVIAYETFTEVRYVCGWCVAWHLFLCTVCVGWKRFGVLPVVSRFPPYFLQSWMKDSIVLCVSTVMPVEKILMLAYFSAVITMSKLVSQLQTFLKKNKHKICVFLLCMMDVLFVGTLKQLTCKIQKDAEQKSNLTCWH